MQYCQSCKMSFEAEEDKTLLSGKKGYVICPGCNKEVPYVNDHAKTTPVRNERGYTFPPEADKGITKSDRILVLLGGLVTVVMVALVTFYFPKDFFHDITRSDSYFDPMETYEVTADPEKLPVSREAAETITIDRVLELREMLTESKFYELNDALEEYQRDFEADQTDEYKLSDAYNSFGITDPSYEKYFEDWKSRYPDNYQPYIAIARYYYAKGWESRGHAFMNDTSDEQVAGMDFYFARVESNVITALKIKPGSMLAHRLMINIANASSYGGNEDELIREALSLFPKSYIIGSRATWAKEPRWNGSYREMEEIARNAEQYSTENPKLTALYGKIYYDQASNLYREKRYAEAVELLTKAIRFGDDGSFYTMRAELYYYKLKKSDLALQDINRAIELRPGNDEYYRVRSNIYQYGLKEYDLALQDINFAVGLQPSDVKYYRMRSRIYFALKRFNDSVKDLRKAEDISPGDPDTKEWKSWATNEFAYWGHQLYKDKDYSRSVENCDLALSYDDQNHEGYYWRGKSLEGLSRYDLAFADFEKAIEVNPRHFESYQMLDYLLAKERKWPDIIPYWDRFLALEPEHAAAYLERAGTHYHNKDLTSSLRDLERGCELGNKEACSRRKMVQSKM